MPTGTRFVDRIAFVHAFKEAVPSSANPTSVSLKGYDHVSVLVSFKNATKVTGSAIGLQQATAVSGANAKTLAFTQVFARVDDSVSCLLTATPAVFNSFTTDATNSKNGFYLIEVDAAMLDNANAFDCMQVTIGNAVAATIGAHYWLGVTPRFGGCWDSMMNPLVD